MYILAHLFFGFCHDAQVGGDIQSIHSIGDIKLEARKSLAQISNQQIPIQ